MPGFDATGPSGYGPMTGGRRGYCAGGGAPSPLFGRGRGRRNMYHLTGLTGWGRAAQTDSLRAEPDDVSASLDRIDRSLDKVLRRLERLEAERGE